MSSQLEELDGEYKELKEKRQVVRLTGLCLWGLPSVSSQALR